MSCGAHHGRKARVSDQWEWILRAACRALPSEERDKFFPDDDENPAPEQVAAARLICQDCPVKVPCLEHALAHESYGIWASTTSKERAELRLARRRHDYLVAKNCKGQTSLEA